MLAAHSFSVFNFSVFHFKPSHLLKNNLHIFENGLKGGYLEFEAGRFYPELVKGPVYTAGRFRFDPAHQGYIAPLLNLKRKS